MNVPLSVHGESKTFHMVVIELGLLSGDIYLCGSLQGAVSSLPVEGGSCECNGLPMWCKSGMVRVR